MAALWAAAAMHCYVVSWTCMAVCVLYMVVVDGCATSRVNVVINGLCSSLLWSICGWEYWVRWPRGVVIVVIMDLTGVCGLRWIDFDTCLSPVCVKMGHARCQRVKSRCGCTVWWWRVGAGDEEVCCGDVGAWVLSC